MGERREGRERDIHLLLHSSIHSMGTLVCTLTEDGTCNRGASGQCSNYLSYPTRASAFFFFFNSVCRV